MDRSSAHPVPGEAPGAGEGRRAWNVRLYRAAVTIVMAAFFLACFYGIANYWQWGHNGYNGAAFTQAARNSIRFGKVGQAQYHTGLRAPKPAQMYTHHPMMLHLHLIGIYRLLGFHEMVGRLVPALYSFFTLVLLFVIVRRLGGKVPALLSITIYTLTPINLIFANMINHEQGGIFWCLMLVYMYILWLGSYRWIYMLLSLIAVTMAAQFDWPGYYISFFIAIHAMVMGIAQHRGRFRWRPEYTWTVVFSAVVLLNFLLFFLWIALYQGSLDQMKDAFQFRTGEISGYYKAIYYRTRDLQGVVPMTLVGSWILLLLGRLLFGKLRLLSLIPLFFIFAQVIHSVVFKQAGIIHSYWTYYLSPAIAIGGAIVLFTIGGWTRKVLKRIILASGVRFRRPWARAAIFAVVVTAALGPLFIYQGQFAWKKLRWGFMTGAASYHLSYDDQFGEVMWARELARFYDRRSVLYMMDRSVQWRIEFMYYLDAPFVPANFPGFKSGRQRPNCRKVILIDLKHLPSRTALSRLIGKYDIKVWDRRFVAIENGPGGKIEAFVSEARHVPLWWRWLVNPKRPPVRWIPDPDPSAVVSLLSPGIKVTAEFQKGGYGGGAEEWDCPGGHVMNGFSATMKKTQIAGMLISAFRPRCMSVLEKGVVDHPSKGKHAFVTGPWIGRWTELKQTEISCERDDMPVGIYTFLYKGSWVAGLGLLCAPVQIGQAGKGGEPEVKFSARYRTGFAGRETGKAIEIPCPAGSVVWGFRGRGGDLIDSAGVSCVQIDAGFISAKDTAIGKTPWKIK